MPRPRPNRKKRLRQAIQHHTITNILSDAQLEALLGYARATVPGLPPPPPPGPSLSFYLRTEEGKLIILAAIVALGLIAVPNLLTHIFSPIDLLRLPLSLLVILAGVLAVPARHTANLSLLRISVLITTCAAVASPFVIPLLTQPAKLAILWPALTALFVVISLTTAHLITLPIRTRHHSNPPMKPA